MALEDRRGKPRIIDLKAGIRDIVDGPDAPGDPVEPIEIVPESIRHFSVRPEYIDVVRDVITSSNRWGMAGNTLLEHPSDEHNPRRLVSIIAASRHMADFLSFDLNDAIAFYDHAKNTGAKDKDQALAILRETFTDPDKMAKRYGTFYAERKDEIFAEMLIVTNGAES